MRKFFVSFEYTSRLLDRPGMSPQKSSWLNIIVLQLEFVIVSEISSSFLSASSNFSFASKMAASWVSSSCRKRKPSWNKLSLLPSRNSWTDVVPVLCGPICIITLFFTLIRSTFRSSTFAQRLPFSRNPGSFNVVKLNPPVYRVLPILSCS